jgi:hypothetical protein
MFGTIQLANTLLYTTSTTAGLVSGYIPFYFSTWESWYTDTVNLPVFNGPTEGLLMAVIMCFVTAFSDSGSQYWHEPRVAVPGIGGFLNSHAAIAESPIFSWLNTPAHLLQGHMEGDERFLSYYNFITASAFFITFVTVMLQISMVIETVQSKGAPESYPPPLKYLATTNSKKHSLVQAVGYNLSPFLFFFVGALYHCCCSKVALLKYPLVLMTLYVSMFLELSTHLMTAQVR